MPSFIRFPLISEMLREKTLDTKKVSQRAFAEEILFQSQKHKK